MKESLSIKTVSDFSRMVRQLIVGCRTIAYDGTVLYTPDGIASYNALWLRDFSYMAEYAPEFIPTAHIKDAVLFVRKHKRADGWMPDRVYADGTVCYAAGTLADPVGKANLDNTPFWVFMIGALSCRMEKEAFGELFIALEPDICKGLSILPLDESGLIFNDKEAPHSPYGFTDTIGKTGSLLMESLLFWRACRIAERLCKAYDGAHTAWYAQKADAVEQNILSLYDAQSGTFYAASGDCKQLDIWGNAYLLYIGFPCPDEVRRSILSWFAAHYEDYCYMGQIRHLPKGEYWQRTLIEVEREEYQNGAYWATAAGWVMWCLQQIDPSLANRMLNEVIFCFMQEGSFECVNRNYRKLKSFVVSATNVYGAITRIYREEKQSGKG